MLLTPNDRYIAKGGVESKKVLTFFQVGKLYHLSSIISTIFLRESFKKQG